MQRYNWRVVCWEIALLVASIPVFRSVWMIFDRMEFMNGDVGILLSLAAGTLLCVLSLFALNRNDTNKPSNASGGKPDHSH
jgi:hypothetical protein